MSGLLIGNGTAAVAGFAGLEVAAGLAVDADERLDLVAEFDPPDNLAAAGFAGLAVAAGLAVGLFAAESFFGAATFSDPAGVLSPPALLDAAEDLDSPPVLAALELEAGFAGPASFASIAEGSFLGALAAGGARAISVAATVAMDSGAKRAHVMRRGVLSGSGPGPLLGRVPDPFSAELR